MKHQPWSKAAFVLVLWFFAWALCEWIVTGIRGCVVTAQSGIANREFQMPKAGDPNRDVIVACLSKDGVLVYGGGPQGLPTQPNQPVTAGMLTLICVSDR